MRSCAEAASDGAAASARTRYRQPRFLNRRRKADWLPPSLLHRLDTTLTWVKRLQQFCPISALSLELVRFDTQLLQDAALSGVEYQQGTLAGYELREYVLEKWGRKCAYCGVEGVPLQIEHLIPTSRGGSSRVSNLTLACDDCNKKKGNRTAAEFGYPQLMDKAKAPLKDAAAINTTRWALWRSLGALSLPLEIGTGGRTKYNRSRLGLAKSHWADAACVGASTPAQLRLHETRPLLIRAVGHGTRQQCRTNASGFPLRHKPRARTFKDWKTGDIVRAVILTGKYTGRHSGRIAIRFRPSFRLNGQIDVHPRYLTRLHRADGYDYRTEERHSLAT